MGLISTVYQIVLGPTHYWGVIGSHCLSPGDWVGPPPRIGQEVVSIWLLQQDPWALPVWRGPGSGVQTVPATVRSPPQPCGPNRAQLLVVLSEQEFGGVWYTDAQLLRSEKNG